LPTPVSALIHAATLVTAGVFLVVRLTPFWGPLVVFIGACTAFMAATFGYMQADLKRVIAFSTCSQLGYPINNLQLLASPGATAPVGSSRGQSPLPKWPQVLRPLLASSTPPTIMLMHSYGPLFRPANCYYTGVFSRHSYSSPTGPSGVLVRPKGPSTRGYALSSTRCLFGVNSLGADGAQTQAPKDTLPVKYVEVYPNLDKHSLRSIKRKYARRTALIYMWHNKESGRCYVGKSVDFGRRLNNYLDPYYQNRTAGLMPICDALRVCGVKQFELYILEVLLQEQVSLLSERESY
jgi:hypothetical protein